MGRLTYRISRLIQMIITLKCNYLSTSNKSQLVSLIKLEGQCEPSFYSCKIVPQGDTDKNDKSLE